MAITRFIILAFFLILWNLQVQAQSSSSTPASVSVTIIHPVGTGGIENIIEAHPQPGQSPGIVNLNRRMLQLWGTNRLLLQETEDKKIIQVLSNGAVFDITVNYYPLIFDNDQEIRIESISPIRVSRNKFFLNTKLDLAPHYTGLQKSLTIPCDIIVHFN